MKLSKKVLAAFSVAAMMAIGFGFTACSEDDDEDDMIQGSGNNKSIDYYNETTSEDTENQPNRGYSTTALKHQGELVRFTLMGTAGDTTDLSKYTDKKYGGVMGFIWDLSTENAEDKSTKRNFWVLGLAVNPTDNANKVKYYVSRYFNVTDIEAANFGAGSIEVTSPNDVKVTNGTACELVHTNFAALTDTTAGKLYIWADIYPTLAEGKTHTPGTQDSKDDYTGGWSIDFYKANEDGSINTSEKYNETTITIDADKTGYTAKTVADGKTANPIPENYMAVYANVYANYRVTGEWYLKSDYHADEVVED